VPSIVDKSDRFIEYFEPRPTQNKIISKNLQNRMKFYKKFSFKKTLASDFVS
jgi:hypothetical protein